MFNSEPVMEAKPAFDQHDPIQVVDAEALVSTSAAERNGN